MKRFVIALSTIALALTIVACGASDKELEKKARYYVEEFNKAAQNGDMMRLNALQIDQEQYMMELSEDELKRFKEITIKLTREAQTANFFNNYNSGYQGGRYNNGGGYYNEDTYNYSAEASAAVDEALDQWATETWEEAYDEYDYDYYDEEVAAAVDEALDEWTSETLNEVWDEYGYDYDEVDPEVQEAIDKSLEEFSNQVLNEAFEMMNNYSGGYYW